jgi:hypothetical protein
MEVLAMVAGFLQAEFERINRRRAVAPHRVWK